MNAGLAKLIPRYLVYSRKVIDAAQKVAAASALARAGRGLAARQSAATAGWSAVAAHNRPV
jgi:hypothetical protein